MVEKTRNDHSLIIFVTCSKSCFISCCLFLHFIQVSLHCINQACRILCRWVILGLLVISEIRSFSFSKVSTFVSFFVHPCLCQSSLSFETTAWGISKFSAECSNVCTNTITGCVLNWQTCSQIGYWTRLHIFWCCSQCQTFCAVIFR